MLMRRHPGISKVCNTTHGLACEHNSDTSIQAPTLLFHRGTFKVYDIAAIYQDVEIIMLVILSPLQYQELPKSS